MEGDMMKGNFTRKDNNKALTTTRVLVGGELVQVSRSTCVFVDKMQDVNLSGINKSLSLPTHRVTATREWMPRGSSRSSNLESEVQILYLHRRHNIE